MVAWATTWESLAWRSAEYDGSIAAYKEFANRFRSGARAKEAISRVNRLRDNKSYLRKVLETLSNSKVTHSIGGAVAKALGAARDGDESGSFLVCFVWPPRGPKGTFTERLERDLLSRLHDLFNRLARPLHAEAVFGYCDSNEPHKTQDHVLVLLQMSVDDYGSYSYSSDRGTITIPGVELQGEVAVFPVGALEPVGKASVSAVPRSGYSSGTGQTIVAMHDDVRNKFIDKLEEELQLTTLEDATLRIIQ